MTTPPSTAWLRGDPLLNVVDKALGYVPSMVRAAQTPTYRRRY